MIITTSCEIIQVCSEWSGKKYDLCLSLTNADALSCLLDDATYARRYIHMDYQIKNVCPGSASQCILRNKNEVET